MLWFLLRTFSCFCLQLLFLFLLEYILFGLWFYSYLSSFFFFSPFLFIVLPFLLCFTCLSSFWRDLFDLVAAIEILLCEMDLKAPFSDLISSFLFGFFVRLFLDKGDAYSIWGRLFSIFIFSTLSVSCLSTSSWNMSERKSETMFMEGFKLSLLDGLDGNCSWTALAGAISS